MWGTVDRHDVEALIKFSRWGKPRSTQTTSTATTTCASSGRSVTASTTTTPATGSLLLTVTTTTPATAPSSVILTLSTSTPAGPSSKSSASKSHYKIRKCPLCHKNHTNLLLDLETREKGGNFKRQNNSSDPVRRQGGPPVSYRNLHPEEKESGEGKTLFF